MTDWPRPFVTVDVAVFTERDGALLVLLIERKHPPYEGRWALPGGFVDVAGGPTGQGEDLEEAARRELVEETGVAGEHIELRQLGAFGTPGRDPRGRTITVVYLAEVPPDTEPVAGDDAARAVWWKVGELAQSQLAFDHALILEQALAARQEGLLWDRRDRR